jgi:hypothetical protein
MLSFLIANYGKEIQVICNGSANTTRGCARMSSGTNPLSQRP